eukprot:5407608-Amphidinium_carterae.1
MVSTNGYCLLFVPKLLLLCNIVFSARGMQVFKRKCTGAELFSYTSTRYSPLMSLMSPGQRGLNVPTHMCKLA